MIDQTTSNIKRQLPVSCAANGFVTSFFVRRLTGFFPPELFSALNKLKRFTVDAENKNYFKYNIVLACNRFHQKIVI